MPVREDILFLVVDSFDMFQNEILIGKGCQEFVLVNQHNVHQFKDAKVLDAIDNSKYHLRGIFDNLSEKYIPNITYCMLDKSNLVKARAYILEHMYVTEGISIDNIRYFNERKQSFVYVILFNFNTTDNNNISLYIPKIELINLSSGENTSIINPFLGFDEKAEILNKLIEAIPTAIDYSSCDIITDEIINIIDRRNRHLEKESLIDSDIHLPIKCGDDSDKVHNRCVFCGKYSSAYLSQVRFESSKEIGDALSKIFCYGITRYDENTFRLCSCVHHVEHLHEMERLIRSGTFNIRAVLDIRRKLNV